MKRIFETVKSIGYLIGACIAMLLLSIGGGSDWMHDLEDDYE